jgi:hypothetical protein
MMVFGMEPEKYGCDKDLGERLDLERLGETGRWRMVYTMYHTIFF